MLQGAFNIHSGLSVAGFPQRWPRFEPGSGHVVFVVDKGALGQIFSEFFDFPCHSFHRLLHTHDHPFSGAGTTGEIVVVVTVRREFRARFKKPHHTRIMYF
jgi:hypothetical protein